MTDVQNQNTASNTCTRDSPPSLNRHYKKDAVNVKKKNCNTINLDEARFGDVEFDSMQVIVPPVIPTVLVFHYRCFVPVYSTLSFVYFICSTNNACTILMRIHPIPTSYVSILNNARLNVLSLHIRETLVASLV